MRLLNQNPYRVRLNLPQKLLFAMAMGIGATGILDSVQHIVPKIWIMVLFFVGIATWAIIVPFALVARARTRRSAAEHEFLRCPACRYPLVE